MNDGIYTRTRPTNDDSQTSDAWPESRLLMQEKSPCTRHSAKGAIYPAQNNSVRFSYHVLR